MENEMLQRVADVITERANPDHDGGIEGEYALNLARHVIEAMREPTEAMIHCSAETEDHFVPYPETCKVTWRAMIKVALEPAKQPA